MFCSLPRSDAAPLAGRPRLRRLQGTSKKASKMSTASPATTLPNGGFLKGLVHRQVDHYPNTSQRYLYLTLTVVATATLYYELYVTAAVNTLQLPDLHMSFVFYASLVAISYLAGAFGSVAAGVVDRYGRVNFLVAGLVITGVLTLWAIPAAGNKTTFAILTCIVGFVEGICLVSTPALIRDYSPQVGRATAMGFWTMGPVLGSLIVSLVASATLDHGEPDPRNAINLIGATSWQHEYYICGAVGIIVAIVCFLFLKELSPRLRDQTMVSMQDRELIEARAAGIDPEQSTKNPWRQMIKPDIVISAIAISVFLLVYYTLVGTSVVYYQTAFKPNADGTTRFPIDKANSLGNWQWLFLLVALIGIGALSDKLKVRKPMMVIGGIGAAVFMVIFLKQAGTAPSFTKMAVIVGGLSFCLGLAYTPWMASFTETIEARNPALTPNGLAVWGWIVRVIITGTFLFLPQVIGTASTLVDKGSGVQAAAAKYSRPLAASGMPAGPLGFAQDPKNADLIAFATAPKNQALVADITKYAPQLATLSTLQAADAAAVGRIAAGAPKPADLKELSQTADGVSAALAKNAAGAPARAAEATKTMFLTLPPGAAAPSGAEILQGLQANQAAVLKTVASLQKAASPAVQAQLLTDSNQLTVLGTLGASDAKTGAPAYPDFAYLNKHGAAVTKAAADTPNQWKTWYWVCFGGIVLFLLTIPLMKGHWSPAKARAEIEAHQRIVDAELAKLRRGTAA